MDLSYNQISSLPDSITKLENLESLYLMRNCIKSLPENIGSMNRLKSLDISYNPLDKLPVQIGKLDNLQTFDASFCLLQKIPVEMAKLQNIIRIHFDDNPIDFPPLKVIRRGWYAIKYYLTELHDNRLSTISIQA